MCINEFSLQKEDFHSLLDRISPLISPVNTQHFGARSSGSCVHAIIKLAATLRLLAGGSYLDIAFGYEILESHVFTYFYQCLEAIDTALDNIHFPLDDEEKLRELDQGFLNISKGIFPGAVAAGDGDGFEDEEAFQ